MRVKLIALGNVLMKDDGIAITVAKLLEEELGNMGIEVIYSETDIGYCITMIQEDDFLILVDAAQIGRWPGEITLLPLEAVTVQTGFGQHEFNLILMLRWYLHNPKGILLAIEINEVSFGYGLSRKLQDKVQEIAKNILDLIIQTLFYQKIPI